MDRNALTAIIIAVAVVLVIVAFVPFLFMPLTMGMAMMPMGMMPTAMMPQKAGTPGPGMMPLFEGIALLFPLLVTVGVVLLAVWAGQALGQAAGASPRAGAPRETPLEILQRRYAAGAIGREEYERICADLTREGAAR